MSVRFVVVIVGGAHGRAVDGGDGRRRGGCDRGRRLVGGAAGRCRGRRRAGRRPVPIDVARGPGRAGEEQRQQAGDEEHGRRVRERGRQAQQNGVADRAAFADQIGGDERFTVPRRQGVGGPEQAAPTPAGDPSPAACRVADGARCSVRTAREGRRQGGLAGGRRRSRAVCSTTRTSADALRSRSPSPGLRSPPGAPSGLRPAPRRWKAPARRRP